MIRWLCTLLMILAPLRAAAEVPELWDIKVAPSPRLGLAFPGADPQYYGLMRDMGIGVVRLSAAWARIEPRAGRFDFRGIDSRVRELQRLGLAPFLTFEPNAKWGAEHTNTVKNGTPRDMGAWTNFVRAVVDRYDGDGKNDMPGLKGRVPYYQTANEFMSPTNRSGGWAGSNPALIEFINATHDAVKAEDPGVTFVLGGVAAFNADIALLALANGRFTIQQRWSASSQTVFHPGDVQSPDVQAAINDRFLPVLRLAKYDMGSVHLYGPETRDTARIRLFRNLTSKPVISSECGGPSRDYGRTYTGQGHYAAVLHRNLNVWAAGSEFCLWFGLGEAIKSTYGNAKVQLYDTSGRPKPGIQAYRLLAKIAPEMTGISSRGSHGFALETREGPIWIGIGAQGRADLGALPTTTPAICVNDAAKRDALRTTWGQLHANCTTEGISLAGAGLISLLQDQ